MGSSPSRPRINHLDPSRDVGAPSDESQRTPAEASRPAKALSSSSARAGGAPARKSWRMPHEPRTSGETPPSSTCGASGGGRAPAHTAPPVSGTLSAASTPYASEHAPRFAPSDREKLLLFVGQDVDSVADYASRVEHGGDVSGVTTYTALSDRPGGSLLGLAPHIAKCPVDYGAGVVDATALLRRFPHAALNLGFDISAASQSGIVRGDHDGHLRKLAGFIKGIAPRPVFLRVGYECDGPWNKYRRRHYGRAFRHIVEELRRQGVDNFASVWQVSASRHAAANDITQYWPGPDVVDWVGMSYFEFYAPAWKSLASIAERHRKPVIICEAAPQGFDIPRGTRAECTGDGRDARRVGVDAVWNAWFRPFFKFVHKNKDLIRAVSYINCNWQSQSMWNCGDQGYWGNTAVTSSRAPKVKRRWEAEVNDRNLWLRATPDMWSTCLNP